MVVSLSPAACYQLFKYGGPETGPISSIISMFSGHEPKVQVNGLPIQANIMFPIYQGMSKAEFFTIGRS
jgi:hypothetical protein